jgi:regulator of RNase E activity RraA
MTRLSDETRNKLKTISTATAATALYKRGFRTQCIQDVHPLGADQPTLVGEAFTLRYMPAREDLNQLSVFRDRAHPQGCPRRLSGRDPGDPADAARRRRRRH